MIFDQLAETEPDSIERANMIASLANIARAIAALRLKAPRL